MKSLYWLALVATALAFAGCGGDTQSDADAGGPVCGDGTVEGDEQCDDGNTENGDGCDFECFIEGVCGDGTVEGREQCEPSVTEGCLPVGHVDECEFVPTAFRWDAFGLADPTVYLTNCDGTLGIILGNILSPTTRGDRTDNIIDIEALDGLVDIGFVVKFSPLAQGDGETAQGEFVVSDCNALEPSPGKAGGPTPCGPSSNSEAESAQFTVTTQTTEACLGPIEGTTDFPVPTVEAGDFGCFVSDPFTVSIGLGSVVSFPLSDAQIAGQWAGNPATGLESGLVRGFLKESDAQGIIDFDLFNGQTLAFTISPDLSPESTCDHRDEHNGETGWWVYFTFAAEPVPWQGGEMCGDGALDEGEMCDIGIASGEENSCLPVLDCDDGLACTEDTLNVGNPCEPVCFHRGIFAEDECCPALGQPDRTTAQNPPNAFQALNPAYDVDCIAKCGDGVVEDYEVCDPGEASPTPCNDEAGHCPDSEYDSTNACTCAPVT